MGRISEAQAAFEEVYAKDLWGLSTLVPPPLIEGEELEADRQQRLATLIQDFMRANDIRSVVEFGCGFWSYAKLIDWTGIRYDGFDVVDGALEWNRNGHGTDLIRFHRVTDGAVLPAADLLISKDVLQHLPVEHVKYYLEIFRNNFRYMLIANDVVPVENMNGDVPAGGYRPLRLELAPFDMPNAVLQKWVTQDYASPTIKHFCLFYGNATGTRAGAVLRDIPDNRPVEMKGAVQRGIVRRIAHDLVVRVPPLARFTGRVLEAMRDRR